MMLKKQLLTVLMLIIANSIIYSQGSPIKRFSLKKEPTEIPSDSLGTTYAYSLSYEVNDDFVLRNATFKLRLTSIDSIINIQDYTLPFNDGIYLTSISPNGLIKDKTSFFILLGNIKSKQKLQLTADFTDSKSLHYNDILTNE